MAPTAAMDITAARAKRDVSTEKPITVGRKLGRSRDNCNPWRSFLATSALTFVGLATKTVTPAKPVGQCTRRLA